MKEKNLQGKIFENLFRIASVFTGIILVVIVGFILMRAWPALTQYGLFRMVFNTRWQPTANDPSFGIGYMVLATFATTLLSLVISVPVGIMTSLFLSKMASPQVKRVVMFFVQLLAGIPSVVFGFFVLRTYVAFMNHHFEQVPGRFGNSLSAGVIVLALMSLPTIISLSVTALDAVNKSYKEASYALGANLIQTIFKVDLRAAKTGIFSSIVLGAGRAIGETMAVILVIGNSINAPTSLFIPIRTLTAGIATEMGYASGMHSSALFAIGIILFILIMILNFSLLMIMKRGGVESA